MSESRMHTTTAVRRSAAGRKVVAVLLTAMLGACSGSGDSFLSPIGGNGGTDTTAPTLVTTTPANLATGVPRTATVSVTFSELIDSASVTNTAFTLDNGVTGTIAVNGATATLTPSPLLPASTTIHGTLSTAIRDRAGNPLAAPATFQFTTAP